MKSNPLVSFCIATYKRPLFLKETIKSALAQTYKNIEIIVSDNDPDQSSKKIVKSFKSSKIIYISQKKNIGMVKNFQTAFKNSHGEYIVFSADDDPFEPKMIEQLMKLRNAYPQAGSYFGAPYLLVSDPHIMKIHNLKKGKNSFRNKKEKIGTVKHWTPSNFLPGFLNYEIFDYFLWSCGMVRRDVIGSTEGFKDLYGSNYLTDFSYIMRVGTNSTMITINKELGSQKIHDNNYGRVNEHLLTLKNAIRGIYEENKKLTEQLHCEKALEKFLRNWVMQQLLGVLRYRKMKKEPGDKRFVLKLFTDITKDFPFFRTAIPEFFFRAISPEITSVYDNYKWIFEKRTFRRGYQKLFSKFI